MMACYLSSCENITLLKSLIDFLTPSVAVHSFFDLLIAELEFEKCKISTFKELELNEIVHVFVKGFKQDIELFTNEELSSIVQNYIVRLRNEYNINCVDL